MLSKVLHVLSLTLIFGRPVDYLVELSRGCSEP